VIAVKKTKEKSVQQILTLKSLNTEKYPQKILLKMLYGNFFFVKASPSLSI